MRAEALAMLVTFVDFVLVQALIGASIGKLCVRLRVVDERGDKANLFRMFGRWLLLVVDAGFFVVGLVATLGTHPHRRVGDLLCGTYVVAASDVGEPIVAAAWYGTAPPDRLGAAGLRLGRELATGRAGVRDGDGDGARGRDRAATRRGALGAGGPAAMGGSAGAVRAASRATEITVAPPQWAAPPVPTTPAAVEPAVAPSVESSAEPTTETLDPAAVVAVPVEPPAEPVVALAVPAPVVTDPVVAEPVVAPSVEPEPVVAQPVVAEPVVAPSVEPEPVVAEPVVALAVPEPVAVEPVVAEPAAPVEPDPTASLAEPEVAPPVAEPAAVPPEPVSPEPEVPDVVVHESVVAEPAVDAPAEATSAAPDAADEPKLGPTWDQAPVGDKNSPKPRAWWEEALESGAVDDPPDG